MKNRTTSDNLEVNQSEQHESADGADLTPHPLCNPFYPAELASHLASYLPSPVLGNLRLVSRTAHNLFTPSFAKEKEKRDAAIQVCKHADRARQQNIDELCKMLDKNPSLLKVKFNILSPSMGLIGRNVTIYEWVLGAATEVKNIIEPYFSKKEFSDGLEECNRQYAKYAPHIDKLFTHPAYDWSDLLEKIKIAPADVVNPLLNMPMLPKEHPAYESALYQAMLKFRADWAPGELDGDNPHMHDVMKTRDKEAKEFSVLNSLREADVILEREWTNLVTASRTKGDENAYSRVRLIWRQVSGFMERRLTGEDRCNGAQGLIKRFGNNEKNALIREEKFTYTWVVGVNHFTDTPSDNSLAVSDLGGGYFVDMYFGGPAPTCLAGSRVPPREALEILCREKKATVCRAPTYAATSGHSISPGSV